MGLQSMHPKPVGILIRIDWSKTAPFQYLAGNKPKQTTAFLLSKDYHLLEVFNVHVVKYNAEVYDSKDAEVLVTRVWKRRPELRRAFVGLGVV